MNTVQVRGTYSWMAPELTETEPLYTKKSDIYSYGIILWEIITRNKPFTAIKNRAAIPGLVKNNGLQEITLNVFDFNTSAIATYKRIGFIEYEFKEAARQFQNEYWNVIEMKINKENWQRI